MAITLDTIDAALHSILISDGTDNLAINADGSLNAVVTATQLDIDDLSHTVDSVKIGDGTDFLAIAADGSIAVTDNGASLTVDAVNLDIRSLTSASDSVEIQTAAGQALAIDASGFITANINGSVTVSATQLDIDDLSHAVDSVSIGDGTDLLAVNTDGSINVRSSDEAFSSWKSTAQSVTAVASQVASTALTGRLKMIVQNLGSQDIFLGESAGVTTSTGTKVAKGSSYEMGWDSGATVYAISASGSADIRISEFAA